MRIPEARLRLSPWTLAGFTTPVAVAVGGLLLTRLVDLLASDVLVVAVVYFLSLMAVNVVALLLAPKSPASVASAMALMDLYWYGMVYWIGWGDSPNLMNLPGLAIWLAMEEAVFRLGLPVKMLPVAIAAGSFLVWYLVGRGFRRLLKR